MALLDFTKSITTLNQKQNAITMVFDNYALNVVKMVKGRHNV